MKLALKLNHPGSPFKVGPILHGSVPTQTDNFTKIPLRDLKTFLPDLAMLYEKEVLTLRDKLIGASFLDDRTIYFGKRSATSERLGIERTIPFAIEIIHAGSSCYVNIIPVASVKKIENRVYYGMSYGDIRVEHLFQQ